MSDIVPMAFALSVGFAHAFEVDHLLAVGNIVTRRKHFSLAVKDGIFWGLGHTSTIFVIGILIILGKLVIAGTWFEFSEGIVGLMLVALGLFRLSQQGKIPAGGHELAYGIGMVHGLAGSGAVVLLAMTEVGGTLTELFYLLAFGVGSMTGMLLAAGMFSFSFSRKLLVLPSLQRVLVLITGVLCVGYGLFLLIESLSKI